MSSALSRKKASERRLRSTAVNTPGRRVKQRLQYPTCLEILCCGIMDNTLMEWLGTYSATDFDLQET